MQVETSLRIVVGLGNPGKEYQGTRHNIGASIVVEFARLQGISLQSDRELEVRMARGTLGTQPFALAIPRLFMNESGRSVGQLVRFFKIGLQSLLVVADDLETPFGEVRLVSSGGTRGHNGLKSIRNVLGSTNFMQVRVGIGRPEHADVAGYVLSAFSSEELGQVPAIMNKTVNLIENWLIGV